jgi:hypothetical protein
MFTYLPAEALRSKHLRQFSGLGLNTLSGELNYCSTRLLCRSSFIFFLPFLSSLFLYLLLSLFNSFSMFSCCLHSFLFSLSFSVIVLNYLLFPISLLFFYFLSAILPFLSWLTYLLFNQYINITLS